MARPAHVYPQVDPRASDIIDIRVTDCPADVSAAQALRLGRRHHARAVIGSRWGSRRPALILVAHLERVVTHGLGSLPARRFAMPVPAVGATASEVAVRRWLLHGAPAVLVMDGTRMVGAVGRAGVRADSLVGASLAQVLRTRLPADTLARVTAAGRHAETRGRRAFLVGDAVRDAVLGAAALDPPTAGAVPEIVDEHPGADTVLAVLARRGFTIDAMAVELSSGAFGLVDPFGGRHDAVQRRLRVVHPLAFLDDPALASRAARYAARGFTLDAAARRARALARGRRARRNDAVRARAPGVRGRATAPGRRTPRDKEQ